MGRKSKKRLSTSEPLEHPVFFVDRDLCGRKFLEILRGADLKVVAHGDLFEPAARDVEFLPEVGRRSWVFLSRNTRIRYTSPETEALMSSGVRAFFFAGASVRQKSYAENFVLTLPAIGRFLRRHRAPFIAKILRPNERDAALGRPGRVKLWLSEEAWRAHQQSIGSRGRREFQEASEGFLNAFLMSD